MPHNSSSNRQQKAASIIHQAIIETFRKGKILDQKLIDMPLTITNVKVSADLKKAYCYFVPFNTKLSSDELLAALKKSKNSIRAAVTDNIQLKYSPDIDFFFDHGHENTRRIEELIEKSKADRVSN